MNHYKQKQIEKIESELSFHPEFDKLHEILADISHHYVSGNGDKVSNEQVSEYDAKCLLLLIGYGLIKIKWINDSLVAYLTKTGIKYCTQYNEFLRSYFDGVEQEVADKFIGNYMQRLSKEGKQDS